MRENILRPTTLRIFEILMLLGRDVFVILPISFLPSGIMIPLLSMTISPTFIVVPTLVITLPQVVCTIVTSLVCLEVHLLIIKHFKLLLYGVTHQTPITLTFVVPTPMIFFKKMSMSHDLSHVLITFFVFLKFFLI